MSNCKNKFLGLESIDVLMKYINTKIEENSLNTKVCTVQIFKYIKNGDKPDYPSNNIYYDYDTNSISFPSNNNGWGTLRTVVDSIKDTDPDLEYGALYTSTRIQVDENSGEYNEDVNGWSYPIKISGTNGRSGLEFRFSYIENDDPENCSKNPLIATEENPIVWFWTKSEDGTWEGPEKWWIYTKDGNDGIQILYRYKVTSVDDIDADGRLIPPPAPTSGNDPDWLNTIPNINLSKEKPYLWLSTAMVLAGSTLAESEEKGVYTGWSDPILFSTVGKDGDVPNYTMTLYTKGAEENGLIKPDSPVFVEDKNISEYIVDPWMEVPTDETGYWWQCTFKIRGLDDTVLEIGDVKRYNGVDGESQPGEWSEFCFKWSEDQTMPLLEVIEGATYPADWTPQYPVPQPNGPETTLWMTVGRFKGMNEDGTPKLISDWCEPIRITGPAGPLSYDYRLEMRYAEGNATAPYVQATWQDDPSKVNITNTYMYLWAKPYLVYYKMKYGDTPKEDGTYPIEQINDVPDGIVREFTPYRLSGLNGDNGNTKNKISYSDSTGIVDVTSFSNENLYIYNGATSIIYKLNYNLIDFETGYTGKFSNIGSGKVTIETLEPYVFIGSGKVYNDSIRSFTLNPQEQVEIICYKDQDKKMFICTGKDISE